MPRDATRCARGRLVPTISSFLSLGLMAGCDLSGESSFSAAARAASAIGALEHSTECGSAPAIAGDAPIAPATTNPGMTSAADLAFVASHAPVWSETGTASWYGPPYNKRRGANGQIFDQDAMTAAHRTLPLNSLIRVTNVRTGQQAVLHVTDRGPFVPGRVLDLSKASAKALGLYVAGTGTVRIDVFAVPAPIETGGTLVRADRARSRMRMRQRNYARI